MTRRDKLIEKLSKYKRVPSHGVDFNELSDEELENMLKLLEATFEEYFSNEYSDDDLVE